VKVALSWISPPKRTLLYQISDQYSKISVHTKSPSHVSSRRCSGNVVWPDTNIPEANFGEDRPTQQSIEFAVEGLTEIIVGMVIPVLNPVIQRLLFG